MEKKKVLDYGAQVTFAPSSIRLYAPPLPVERIPTKKDIVTFPGAYVKLDWNIYACILKEVVSRGSFVAAPGNANDDLPIGTLKSILRKAEIKEP